VYYNRSVTGRYGRERDAAAADRGDATAFADDGIVWHGESRDGWGEQAAAYFEGDQHPVPRTLPENPLESTTSVAAVEAAHGVDPDKDVRETGGVDAAWDRLAEFAAATDEYVGSISPPAAAERDTSRLSAHLTFGTVSPRQAYQHVSEHAVDGRGRERFTTRLYWNRHFSQKLADWPEAMNRAINPVFRGMWRDTHDPDLVAAWKAGETGFPMVDASMRALRETGWMNFRMRAMCASFYTYALQCYWKMGADHFYRHLIDADAAINYQQWQMQSGLVGVHPLRLYNPAKQVRDNDPDGEFVRRYVPELRDLPTEFLDRPERAPADVQAASGVVVGEDYPLPVVDFEARRTASRDAYGAVHDRAREALSDPEIERRASLSERGPRGTDADDGEARRQTGQRSLSDF
jgi:deoxyribodipyrimidine photo-lyase